MKKQYLLLASLLFGIIFTEIFDQQTAQAADHLNLEEGLPTEVEDAYPVPYQGRELQGVLRYDRTGDGKDHFVVEPRLEYGFAPNWQGRIAIPFEFGSDTADGIGDVEVEVFHNFNTETLKMPAFAVSASAAFPTGADSAGVDPSFKFIATKTLGTGANLDRVHLNLGYSINTSAEEEERGDRISAVVGYSRRLNSETILVTDLAYEQEQEKDQDSLLLEMGVRYQRSPLNVIAIGAGVGLTEDSPDFRVTAGFQRSF
ncbi:MAG: transporter [Oscillatoria sp. PMC 1068.18]|nr:transporter [Oscillatoria sp. PMC 1076.18]MEC4987326.1 transporter [Oscillatoria sp. PMC 1068.18]